MSPEKQRIAIAEALGFKIESDGITHCLTPCNMDGQYHPEGKLLKKVPNYLNDLNAIHEAEKTLSHPFQIAEYRRRLSMHFTAHPDDGFRFAIHATAAQRAEAFRKTLNL